MKRLAVLYVAICMLAFLTGCGCPPGGNCVYVQLKIPPEVALPATVEVRIYQVDERSGSKAESASVETKCLSPSCSIRMSAKIVEQNARYLIVAEASGADDRRYAGRNESFIITYGSPSSVDLDISSVDLDSLRLRQSIERTVDIIAKDTATLIIAPPSRNNETVVAFFVNGGLVAIRLSTPSSPVYHFFLVVNDSLVAKYESPTVDPRQAPIRIYSADSILMTDKATFDTLRQLFLTQNVSFPASGPRTGLYVFASGRNTLTDCANQERWWVTGEPAEMARLHRTYRETRETPGKPIAIHFSGTFARAPRSIDSNDSVSGDINLTNFTPVMVEYAASCPR